MEVHWFANLARFVGRLGTYPSGQMAFFELDITQLVLPKSAHRCARLRGPEHQTGVYNWGVKHWLVSQVISKV